MTGIEIYNNGKPIEELSKYNGPLIIDILGDIQLIEHSHNDSHGHKHLIINYGCVMTKAPVGSFQVKNMYVNSEGKLVYEFDNGE